MLLYGQNIYHSFITYPISPVQSRFVPSSYWVRGEVHHGQDNSPSQSHRKTNKTNSHSLLGSSIQLTCNFCGSVRYQEPFCCEATGLNTTPPCNTNSTYASLSNHVSGLISYIVYNSKVLLNHEHQSENQTIFLF